MRKALIVRGGWEGHQPRECTERFLPFLRSEGFEVDVCETTEVYARPGGLAGLDLLVQCWTMGNLEPDQEAGLVRAVEEGLGLAGWHGGLCDSFRGTLGYQWLTGGQFLAHPGDIKDYRLRVTRPDDPIMQGIDDFDIRSEQYYMMVDPAVEVLADTIFETPELPWIDGVAVPQVWKRRWGRGRVFFAAPGHVATDFDLDPLTCILQRGMLWAAGNQEP